MLYRFQTEKAPLKLELFNRIARRLSELQAQRCMSTLIVYTRFCCLHHSYNKNLLLLIKMYLPPTRDWHSCSLVPLKTRFLKYSRKNREDITSATRLRAILARWCTYCVLLMSPATRRRTQCKVRWRWNRTTGDGQEG